MTWWIRLFAGVRCHFYLVQKAPFREDRLKFFLLTQTGKFIGVRCVNHVNEGLQLELSNGRVLVVVEHGEPEGGLDLVRTLLENRTCEQDYDTSLINRKNVPL